MGMNRSYPAKLILFGEYTVINKSEAMAIPFRLFKGKWEFELENFAAAIKSREKLVEIHSYLDVNNFNNLDLHTFKTDISNGIWFSSNIPFGYGSGSSGALCAAIYDRYAIDKTSDLILLREYLGRIESFFHGTSSGTDPLVSYLDKPIKISEDQSISILPELKDDKNPKTFVLVIDCGFSRESDKLVKHYLENCTDPLFMSELVEPIKKQVKICIKSILNRNTELIHSTKIISELQLRYMKNMIPNKIQTLWEEGVKSKKFSLKLCGAGGGGFMLAFCYDKDTLAKNFEGFNTYKLISL